MWALVVLKNKKLTTNCNPSIAPLCPRLSCLCCLLCVHLLPILVIPDSRRWRTVAAAFAGANTASREYLVSSSKGAPRSDGRCHSQRTGLFCRGWHRTRSTVASGTSLEQYIRGRLRHPIYHLRSRQVISFCRPAFHVWLLAMPTRYRIHQRL